MICKSLRTAYPSSIQSEILSGKIAGGHPSAGNELLVQFGSDAKFMKTGVLDAFAVNSIEYMLLQSSDEIDQLPYPVVTGTVP